MPGTKSRKRPSIEDVTSDVSNVGHPDDVFKWRKEQWEKMGFPSSRARYLADTRIDLHTAAEYLKNNCPLQLIEDILLGTCHSGEDEAWGRKAISYGK